MNYEQLSSVLLKTVFSNSAIKTLEEFVSLLANPSDDAASASLTAYEWERLRWGYWAGAYVCCIAAWTDTWQLFQLDNDRLMTLFEDGYESRIANDTTRILVGNYLRNRHDLKALKRTGAVPCSLFSRIEDQVTTRGTLSKALAGHRVNTLCSAFLEGLEISSLVDQKRFQAGEPIGETADLISGLLSRMPNRTKDGLSRTAVVFAGLMLDSGESRGDEKSLNVSEMVFERFEETYQECRDKIGMYANPEA